jgi:ferredoxin-NADP reductase
VAELTHARALSPSVRSLAFRVLDGRAVGHRAGQFLDLIVPTSRGLPYRRSYSIATAPTEGPGDIFEIAVTRVEGGPTSEALHALSPGARVEIEGPEGNFVRTANDLAHPALFVAAGTGLAPIRAMLAEDVRAPHGPPLVLLFGCRTPNDLLWREQLRAWEKSCPRLRMHVTLSRAPPEWSGLVGYVQRHVRELASALPECRAYVCGLTAMVDEVVALLAASGMPRQTLRYETYD